MAITAVVVLLAGWYVAGGVVPARVIAQTAFDFHLFIVPAFFALALMAGGFAAAWSSGSNWLVASLVVAPPFVAVCLVISGLTIGAPTSDHIVLVLVSFPAAIAGGFLASRVAG